MQPSHFETYHSARFPNLNASWREWLLYPGSFMRSLETAGVKDSRIHVIKQGWEFPAREEAKLLSIPPRQFVLIREVLIGKGKKEWMFARTVIPRATLTGKEQLLARLKNRALGTILFKDKNTQRTPFQISLLTPDTKRYHYIANLTKLNKKNLWARRSLFFINHKSLLLEEVFLPDMQDIIKVKA